ncbi:unnamed protein product, partial [Scytosiphon promiscuus]
TNYLCCNVETHAVRVQALLLLPTGFVQVHCRFLLPFALALDSRSPSVFPLLLIASLLSLFLSRASPPCPSVFLPFCASLCRVLSLFLVPPALFCVSSCLPLSTSPLIVLSPCCVSLV